MKIYIQIYIFFFPLNSSFFIHIYLNVFLNFIVKFKFNITFKFILYRSLLSYTYKYIYIYICICICTCIFILHISLISYFKKVFSSIFVFIQIRHDIFTWIKNIGTSWFSLIAQWFKRDLTSFSHHWQSVFLFFWHWMSFFVLVFRIKKITYHFKIKFYDKLITIFVFFWCNNKHNIFSQINFDTTFNYRFQVIVPCFSAGNKIESNDIKYINTFVKYDHVFYKFSKAAKRIWGSVKEKNADWSTFFDSTWLDLFFRLRSREWSVSHIMFQWYPSHFPRNWFDGESYRCSR